jgi:23S rRNA maturation-related 3'-5' exoribonuclease YhaM
MIAVQKDVSGGQISVHHTRSCQMRHSSNNTKDNLEKLQRRHFLTLVFQFMQKSIQTTSRQKFHDLFKQIESHDERKVVMCMIVFTHHGKVSKLLAHTISAHDVAASETR